MRFISNKTIRIDRELSELDKFTTSFIRILRKASPYVIISGYVSILLGRSRMSEDVDIIIPKLEFDNFKALFQELEKGGFWCINAELPKTAFELLNSGVAIRFAKQGTAIPNMEVKFAKTRIDLICLDETLDVEVGPEKITISNLELQIAFKEKVLGSNKDLEDAKHLRLIGKDHLDASKIKKYEVMLNGHR